MAKNTIADLTKKIDINNIVKGVKSMINPTALTPDVDADDSLGVKLAQISTLVQSVANIQAQQTKEFAKINKLVNELYNDIEAIRNPAPETETTAKATKKPAAKKTTKKATVENAE